MHLTAVFAALVKHCSLGTLHLAPVVPRPHAHIWSSPSQCAFVYPPQLPSLKNGPKASRKRASSVRFTRRCLKLGRLRWLRVVTPVLVERKFDANSAPRAGTLSAQILPRMQSKLFVTPVVHVGFARRAEHQTEDNLHRVIPASSSYSVSHQRCCSSGT